MWDASGSDRGRLAGLAGGAGAGRGTSGVPSLLGHLLDLVHRDGQDDHRSGDDRLPEGGHTDDDEAVAQESDHECTDERAADGPSAPGERGTADDDRRDRVQFVELARSAVAELMLATCRMPTIAAHSPDRM
jgi:hypothetical protein